MIAFNVIMTQSQPPLYLSKLLKDSLCGGTITSESLTVFQKVNTSLWVGLLEPQGLGSLHKTRTTQHPTLHINKHTFAYKELVQGYVFNFLPRSRIKSNKGWRRPADRFSFLGLSKVPSEQRAAGSLGTGKSPLGLQCSKPKAQLPAARMAVVGTYSTRGFWAAQG